MISAKTSLDESDQNQIREFARINPSCNFKLRMIQQPIAGKAVSNTLRAKSTKWPIEPPPVLELISPERDPKKRLYIHNPNWFCVANAVCIEASKKTNVRKDHTEGDGGKDNLFGLLASSLHGIKNPSDGDDHGYFVFGDLNVRDPGRYKLEFTLFEMRHYDQQVYAARVDSVFSNDFMVGTKVTLPSKDSTKLSRTLGEQGVRLRLRKESRKRKTSTFSWSSTTKNNIQHYRQPAVTTPTTNQGQFLSGRTSIEQNPMSNEHLFAGPQFPQPQMVLQQMPSNYPMANPMSGWVQPPQQPMQQQHMTQEDIQWYNNNRWY